VQVPGVEDLRSRLKAVDLTEPLEKSTSRVGTPTNGALVLGKGVYSDGNSTGSRRSPDLSKELTMDVGLTWGTIFDVPNSECKSHTHH
jgi:hypothetical protein